MARQLQHMGMRHANWIIAALFWSLCPLWPQALAAMNAPDCETIAARLGAQAGLPEGLLPAIARIESGRSGQGGTRAWPWTLNTAGQGHYFDSSAEALGYLDHVLSEGQRNVDIGCMQINYRWHGENFPSVQAMMDPVTNISYAIAFLQRLRAETGSWSGAVQRYHSNDPARGTAYHARFVAALDRVQNGQGAEVQFASAVPDSIVMPPEVDGLYATYLGGTDKPLVPGIGSAGQDDMAAAYDTLLAILAEADAQAPQTPATPVVLVKRVEEGEIGRRWDDVEGFRAFFRDEPAG